MKRVFAVLLAGLAVAVLSSIPASATCTDNGTTEFCLNVPNVAPTGFAPGDIVVKIVYDDTGTPPTLTVTIDSCVGCAPGFKIGDVGTNAVNSAGANLFSTNIPPGWSTSTGNCCDGFGFANSWVSSTHEPGGTSTFPVVFNLTGNAVYPQEEGFLFAVHLQALTPAGCSLWITNNQAFTPGQSSPQQQEQCGGTTEVPEPGSLALLGTGLFSAVGVLRRKLLKA